MSRASMATLITRVREYIGDPASNSQTFTDDQIQEALDLHRVAVGPPGVPLRPQPQLLAGGVFDYVDYYADVGEWETDYTLQGPGYQTLTPTLAEETVGHWQLPATGPAGQIPPVYITGKVYDCHGAAADLLRMWAALVALDFDYTLDGQSVKRSQKREALLLLAAEHRRMARPQSWSWDRSDMNTPAPAFAHLIGSPFDATGGWFNE